MKIEPASVMVEGRPVSGVIATCKCGVLTSVAINKIADSKPEDQERKRDAIVGRKLEAKGWKVLKRKDGHSCPGCVARDETAMKDTFERHAAVGIQIVKDFKDMKPTIANAHFAGPSTDAPAELTRENRRIILSKLEEVYVDEKTGYSANWSDAKVATDLGVPRAWVTQLRSENFGPEGNEHSRAILDEARALLKQTHASLNAMQPHLDAISELKRRAEKIERTIIDVEKGLRA